MLIIRCQLRIVVHRKPHNSPHSTLLTQIVIFLEARSSSS